MSKGKRYILFTFIFFSCLVLWATDYSIQFNANGQYLDCGTSSYYDLSNNLTVEAWIYPTNFKNNKWENTIASKVYWTPTNSYGWSFRYGSSSGILEFNMSGGGNVWIDCTANYALTLNTWQHVAATYNGSVVKLYVNGNEVASVNASSSIPSAPKKLLIGAIDQTGDWRNMVGNIDQVRIWKIARSQNEINNNLYTTINDSDLIGDFRFTSGSGTTAINSANASYNASLVNSIWSDNIPYYSVNISTGNISGVNISTSTEDYGNDPGTIICPKGFSASFTATKDNYIWNLATGSDSNIISNLNSDKNISFLGTFTLSDLENGFTYSGQEDIEVSATEGSVATLEAPAPANASDSDIVMVFNAITTTDLKISVPLGSWYVIAYYNDPEDGGLTWHQGNQYPASGPTDVIFLNVPFGSKSDVPIIISSEDATLPVTFASFTAFCSGENSVSLNWETHSESNLSGFSVLRSNDNNLSFASLVSSMVYATNTSISQNYSFVDQTLTENGLYYYWLKITELGGSNYYHGPVTVLVEDNFENPVIDIPLQNKLHNAYPNPFNPTTTISYTIKEPAHVKLEIFDIIGRKIWNKSLTHNQAGDYSIIWNGLTTENQKAVSGIYFCRMTIQDKSWTQKMILKK